MKIDVVSIFPVFFNVLELSLLGKARARGMLDFAVHDLRDHTHDKHRTVDGTPAGGGAGMVMKAEPWGSALDSLIAGGTDPLLIFPAPAGEVFNQRLAHELAAEKHLIFGCGRYEGIDQRVFDEYTARARVKLVSLGDYVLNGGEVATVAIIEAVARLLPGMVGNPESLVEESHEGGMLEYPNYTQPAVWRGREIPEVLRSGNHAAIAKWRAEQRLLRTRELRPDLLGDAD
ncbi:tRNA (guanosine(37)-N1)-methyltransferase TrmD [Canibacter sp. lx-72]|uniref:tRNA (guanosine(37)-N1)-methyltransferase TrmD n=1 Tax=Canibacter zhuwentaonis TaxID=2837491 RepID=UPI001BDBD501|nr:tRNA (guanosine(37)-N1)-methyltransferase TrmD [Canibacter zhuwentaonis]MBT1017758.1 tRNA (guanosine(37)-N1)-methyltransferase TrmD [Canibacter zhuwentaonis]MBT1034913.1 tRNA (guanosine(37)-N1)-methyltransferase TrmD [Canibacter zhuwentaonis]